MPPRRSPPPAAAGIDALAADSAYGPHLGPPLRGYSAPGLTASGAIVAVLVLGTLGVLIDATLGGGLGRGFAVFFVVGCALAGAFARPGDTRAVVVAVPLEFLAFAVVVADQNAAGAGLIVRHVSGALSHVVFGAPVLVTGIAVTIVAAMLRRVLRMREDAGARSRTAAHWRMQPSARARG